MRTGSGQRGLWELALVPAMLFLVALGARVLPWPTVLTPDRVVFFGMDAWYHMRRIAYSLAHATQPLAFDPYVNFPDGAKPIWPPAFDTVIAWVLAPVYAAEGLVAVERAAALLPPVLGAACVVALYFLARRHFDMSVAVLASILLTFLSAHFWYSQIGFLDHHVAVALVSTLWLATGMRLLAELSARSGLAPWYRLATAGALAALLLLLWPGSVLHVGIVQLGWLVFWMSRPEIVAAERVALRLAVANAVAFAIVVPAAIGSDWPGWSPFSPAVSSWFQPWMFGVLALQNIACWGLWRISTAGASRAVRAVQIVVVGASILAVSALAIPELVAGGEEAWQWFTKDEVFQGLVKESKPLFVSQDGFDLSNAELRLSRFFYLFPFALVALAWRARRSADRASLWLLAFHALLLAAVTVLQRRFFNSLAPAFALVIAWACLEVLRALPAAVRETRPRRALVAVLATALGVWMMAPSLVAWWLPSLNGVAVARGQPLIVPKPEISRRVLLETAAWIRENTPPTSGYLDPDAQPEYGVLAPWGYGHLIKYVAQRPTVVGNFGDDVGEKNLRRTNAYLASPESVAVGILDDLGVRYVLVQTPGRVPKGRLQGAAMHRRLSVDDSPGLEHHRLVYESFLDSGRRSIGRSEFRVFERVAGAVVEGRAPPGSVVSASLDYRSNRGRRGRFESTTKADAAGTYRLRVPYATRGVPPGVEPEGAYRFSAGEAAESVDIEEADVQRGVSIPGPDFS